MGDINPPPNDESSEKWAMFGSLAAAIGATACCLGPLVLVSFGVTGAWIGNLSALEPYRPVFMIIAVGLLGYGFYRVYGKPRRQQACGEGERCEVPGASRINQVSLWIGTVFVALFLASPYLLGLGLDPVSAEARAPNAVGAGGTIQQHPMNEIALDISGMTCAGCTHAVSTALADLNGVEKATVSYEPPRAHVSYDPEKVTPAQLTRATENVGYPSSVDR